VIALPVEKLVLSLLSIGFVLYLHGAVPFLATPTLGQAVWTTGFSQSFINESILSFYANNFGAPEPAAIAFGLAGAWPAALFMKVGLHPADAYSAMVALWLMVAFYSAYKIGRFFGLGVFLAILGAISWLSMPVIWAHSGYSMVSIGIGLLSFYFLAAINLFVSRNDSRAGIAKKSFLYIAACIISAFMDGYSFMMFAVGASILAMWVFAALPEQRHRLLYCAIHVVGFGLAYLLYAFYIGKAQFEAAPIDFFRGWGVDFTFLAIPTQGMHWLPDLLNWSVPRSNKVFFGDSSVWKTTFSLPLIIGSVWAWWKVRKEHKLATGILLVAAFGLYMALGPSLKINSVKPEGVTVGPAMPAEYAVAPTGSALLSENLPGFKNMRASYRWLALATLGGWLLLVLMLSTERRKTAISAATIITLVTVFNLPNLPKHWGHKVDHRMAFLQIDADLLEDMKQVIKPGEVVAFLPYRNDFLVNYLAARLNIVSYNIGGDKNLAEARAHWPETMRQFPMGAVDANFADRVVLLLARNEADAVILPYIDMLRAAHRWPYPPKYKQLLRPVVSELNRSRFVEIAERDYYATARLNEESAHLARAGILEDQVLKTLCLAPMCLRQQSFSESTPSRVGTVKNGQLVSDGRRGFLLFGPYQPLDAGRYRLVVYGEGSVVDTAWVDVVSEKGTVQHAKFPLSSTGDQGKGVLAEGLVTLAAPVQDVEVRVFVGEQDVICLEGYELVPEISDEKSGYQ